MITVALKKTTLISSQASLLYLSLLIIVLNISLIWQNSAHQGPQVTTCFPECRKPTEGNPSLAHRRPIAEPSFALFHFQRGE